MVMAIPVILLGLMFVAVAVLLPIALLVALQVWMCKKNLKLGLILPALALAFSLIMVYSIPAYTTVGGSNMRVTDETGQTIIIPDYQGPVGNWHDMMEMPTALPAIVIVFLVTNIPTAVFGGIWLHYKGRRDTLEDLRRMQIKDLE